MKTAISIPNQTYQDAERIAVKLGLSRSALYTKAIEEFISRQRIQSITDQLNTVYNETDLTLEEQNFTRAAAQEGLKSVSWQ